MRERGPRRPALSRVAARIAAGGAPGTFCRFRNASTQRTALGGVSHPILGGPGALKRYGQFQVRATAGLGFAVQVWRLTRRGSKGAYGQIHRLPDAIAKGDAILRMAVELVDVSIVIYIAYFFRRRRSGIEGEAHQR